MVRRHVVVEGACTDLEAGKFFTELETKDGMPSRARVCSASAFDEFHAPLSAPSVLSIG